MALLQGVAYMQGRCVLPEYSNRGAYRSLRIRGLDRLQERGIDSALIRAHAKTPGPIAAAMGFEQASVSRLAARFVGQCGAPLSFGCFTKR